MVIPDFSAPRRLLVDALVAWGFVQYYADLKEQAYCRQQACKTDHESRVDA
jgi:hypothetical protein